MLHIICGVVLVHFAFAAPMESDIQRSGAETKRAVCPSGKTHEPRSCPYWKSNNYCDASSKYSGYVLKHCPITCGKCKAAVAKVVPVCPSGKTHEPRSCPYWKSNNYCDASSKYSGYVLKHCPITCGKCKAAVAKVVPVCPSGKTHEPRSCPYWKSNNYCDASSKYSGYVLKHCPITCGKCKVCPSGKTHEPRSCPYWKSNNYCDASSKYSGYVLKHCPITCGKCKAKSTTASGKEGVNPSDCLGAHNSKRRLHRNTLDLTWDAGLARESKAWADKLAKENRFDHGSSGENLYRFGTTGTGLRTCRDAVNAWYNEIQYYNWNKPGKTKVVGKAIGHFTQVVWKNTARVGCGTAKIKIGKWNHVFIVCRYSPPGNFRGRYGSNVMALK